MAVLQQDPVSLIDGCGELLLDLADGLVCSQWEHMEAVAHTVGKGKAVEHAVNVQSRSVSQQEYDRSCG